MMLPLLITERSSAGDATSNLCMVTFISQSFMSTATFPRQTTHMDTAARPPTDGCVPPQLTNRSGAQVGMGEVTTCTYAGHQQAGEWSKSSLESRSRHRISPSRPGKEISCKKSLMTNKLNNCGWQILKCDWLADNWFTSPKLVTIY